MNRNDDNHGWLSFNVYFLSLKICSQSTLLSTPGRSDFSPDSLILHFSQMSKLGLRKSKCYNLDLEWPPKTYVLKTEPKDGATEKRWNLLRNGAWREVFRSLRGMALKGIMGTLSPCHTLWCPSCEVNVLLYHVLNLQHSPLPQSQKQWDRPSQTLG